MVVCLVKVIQILVLPQTLALITIIATTVQQSVINGLILGSIVWWNSCTSPPVIAAWCMLSGVIRPALMAERLLIRKLLKLESKESVYAAEIMEKLIRQRTLSSTKNNAITV